MHYYDKFYGDLPDNLTYFKAKTNALFPWIYDTKTILNNKPSFYDNFKVG